MGTEANESYASISLDNNPLQYFIALINKGGILEAG